MSNVRGSAYLLAALGALAFCLVTFLPHRAVEEYTGLAGINAPLTLANFQSPGNEEVSPTVRAALSSADLLSRTYRNKQGGTVQLTLIAGTDRSALHDPRSCIIGAGWRIENDHLEALPGTSVTVRTCHIVQEETRQAYELVYLYVVDKHIINQVTEIRLQMLLSALIGRRHTPAVFVRFMRPLNDTGTADGESRAEFLTFAARMWEAMALDRS